jgi:F-type H+-transporting ATPase subunit epsilon|tara:strand:+ start:6003 stop:6413 length:411 start_codon:yes stop_codon:yes gene_type:complete
MAAQTVEFELVSPESLLRSQSVAMVVVPGSEGDFGVLPQHAALISSVRPGVISVYESDRHQVSDRIFIAGGFAEVTPQRCTILAQVAIPLSEIDKADAQQEVADAREDLADAKGDIERKHVAERLAIAEAKLHAVS